MGIDIRLPQFTAQTEKEQLQQVKSYLFQLASQLQWALQNIDSTNGSTLVSPTPQSLVLPGRSGASPYTTFNSIKALIIKSAEIVDAYYEEINRRLEGLYVAKSDFGDFVERTSQEIEETSTSTTQRFENLQIIITNIDSQIADTNGSVAGLGVGLNDANSRIADVDEDLQESKVAINDSIQGVQRSVTGVNALLEDAKAQLQGSLDDLEVYITGLQNSIIGVTAYLKSGLLYYTDAGIPVYGLEIGQSVRDEVAGTEVFNKYARFTSEKLSFYDNNGNEVAYISDKKLYIRFAEITVALQIGGIIQLVMANGDVVEKWVGG